MDGKADSAPDVMVGLEGRRALPLGSK